MNLETGHMIALREGEEMPEGYYPVPADIAKLIPEKQLTEAVSLDATRQKYDELVAQMAPANIPSERDKATTFEEDKREFRRRIEMLTR